MGKKKPDVKKYRTNPDTDTISINMEQVANDNPLLREHSGPFLTNPDDVSSLGNPPRARDLYKKGVMLCSPSEPHKNLKPTWKPTVYNGAEFDRILWGPKHRRNLGRNKKEIYAVKGNRVVNLVYDAKDNSCVFREQMVLPKEKIEKLQEELRGDSGIYDYLSLMGIFQAQEHRDIANKLMNENYIPEVKVIVGAVPYHSKSGKRNY